MRLFKRQNSISYFVALLVIFQLFYSCQDEQSKEEAGKKFNGPTELFNFIQESSKNSQVNKVKVITDTNFYIYFNGEEQPAFFTSDSRDSVRVMFEYLRDAGITGYALEFRMEPIETPKELNDHLNNREIGR
ncbi:MAG: hypothetical protein R2879_03040 [Saprospiraceae bacterium]